MLTWYRFFGETAVSARPDLPYEVLPAMPAEGPSVFLTGAAPDGRRASFCVSDPRQLAAETEDIAFLDPRRIGAAAPELPPRAEERIGERRLRGVCAGCPDPDFARSFDPARPGRRSRVNLLAVGNVGSTLLIGLKLLGGDCISKIGICDLNEKNADRWAAEMGQVSWPWNYGALPEVETVPPERMFDCDVFLFAAARSVPEVGSGVRDVRMAQLEANRPLVADSARRAREAGFRGLFVVVSDPVDPLCREAYLASGLGPDGRPDGKGLLPEQIQGFGLGVMNARAADAARRDSRFASFLTDGRSFGPHGRGLVIANSLTAYDDALSRELTDTVLAANLRIRELGFKPYAAPALSSGALTLLLTLRGEWHCSSVPLGGIWFGCKNRFTPYGLETEALPLPDALFARLRETEALLRAIR